MIEKLKNNEIMKTEDLKDLKIKCFEIRNQLDILDNKKQQLILEYNKIFNEINKN